MPSARTGPSAGTARWSADPVRHLTRLSNVVAYGCRIFHRQIGPMFLDFDASTARRAHAVLACCSQATRLRGARKRVSETSDNSKTSKTSKTVPHREERAEA